MYRRLTIDEGDGRNFPACVYNCRLYFSAAPWKCRWFYSKISSVTPFCLDCMRNIMKQNRERKYKRDRMQNCFWFARPLPLLTFASSDFSCDSIYWQLHLHKVQISNWQTRSKIIKLFSFVVAFLPQNFRKLPWCRARRSYQFRLRIFLRQSDFSFASNANKQQAKHAKDVAQVAWVENGI